MIISTRIRALRLARGWTQAELAKRSGMAQPNLAAFESGARKPSLFSLELIAEGLDSPAASLLNESPALVLGRFAMDALARALVGGKSRPQAVPEMLWRDLQALFFTKLRVLAPAVRRRRPRISPYAAQKRSKAWLGEALDELTRRLEKYYPEEGT
jgi:transcriptional regulator with XRE-family HTH domain